MIWKNSTKTLFSVIAEKMSDIEKSCRGLNSVVVKYIPEVVKFTARLEEQRKHYEQLLTAAEQRNRYLMQQYVNLAEKTSMSLTSASSATPVARKPDLWALFDEVPVGDESGYSENELSLDGYQERAVAEVTGG